MYYLAMDQSPSRIGYALGAPDAEPTAGRINPCGRTLLLDVYGWLRNGIIRGFDVKKVIWEAPVAGPHTNFERSARPNCELIAIFKLVCLELEIPCEEVTSNTWRRHFLGVGSAPKGIKGKLRRQWLKDEAMRQCNERNWKFKNDDEAEALGILDWALCKDFPQYGAAETPLLRVGAA